MISLLAGSVVLSILHAVIPNHWLPVLAVGKKENWDLGQITRVTFLIGLSHAASTVLIGFLLAYVGAGLSSSFKNFSTLTAPALLITLGVFFIYQHMRH